MAQWVKTITSKPDDLIPMPRALTEEGENPFQKAIF